MGCDALCVTDVKQYRGRFVIGDHFIRCFPDSNVKKKVCAIIFCTTFKSYPIFIENNGLG